MMPCEFTNYNLALKNTYLSSAAYTCLPCLVNYVVTIFKSPVVTTILLQSFLLGAVYQSYLYYLPMYFQNARQYSVMQSAATSVALVALQSVSSIASGQYISRRKRYGEILWTGFGLWTL